MIKTLDNAVIHTIAGVNTVSDYKKLADNHMKVLILGYKNYRRGEAYIKDNPYLTSGIEALSQALPSFWNKFKVVRNSTSKETFDLGSDMVKMFKNVT